MDLIKKSFLSLVILAAVATASPAQAGYSYSTCSAFTYCPQGGAVQCMVYGESSSSTACFWKVIPGYAVECRGFDSYGNWQDYWATCY